MNDDPLQTKSGGMGIGPAGIASGGMGIGPAGIASGGMGIGPAGIALGDMEMEPAGIANAEQAETRSITRKLTFTISIARVRILHSSWRRHSATICFNRVTQNV